MLTWKTRRKSKQFPDDLLTTAPWALLDKVAGRICRFGDLRDQLIDTVRPEVVIVSTLQQLLQAEKEDRAYAYITLERIGKTIRHAASKGSPGSWFDLKSWMYAVFLSAQPPPDDIQASCLYDVVKLQQLNHMLSVAPQSEGTTIPFFRKLLEVSGSRAISRASAFPSSIDPPRTQDTLELCEGGYDPRQGIGAKKPRPVFRQTDEILLQWAVPEVRKQHDICCLRALRGV